MSVARATRRRRATFPTWPRSSALFDADGTTGPGARTSPYATVLAAVARLAEIPGVSPDLARAIIAETVLDLIRDPASDREGA